MLLKIIEILEWELNKREDEISRNKIKEAINAIESLQEHELDLVKESGLDMYRIEAFSSDLVIAHDKQEALRLYVDIIGETDFEERLNDLEMTEKEFIKFNIKPLHYDLVLTLYEWEIGEHEYGNVEKTVAEVLTEYNEPQFFVSSDY